MQFKIRSSLFILLIGWLTLGVASCAPAATATPLAPASTQPGETFTSERFGYTFVYPPAWIVKDRSGEWAAFDPLDPNVGRGIDAFAAYVDGRNLALGLGARPLDDGTDLARWVETAKGLILDGVSRGVCREDAEGEPAAVEDRLLDGEPAVLLEYVCPAAHDSYGLVLLAIHGDEGYWITWLSPQGNAAEDRAEFGRILETFSFTD